MENKYFTPDIEDIHIGYECEILYPHNMIEYNKKLNENLWEKHKFELRESLSEGDSMSFDYIFRTLYLTNKQIEAEGWVYVSMDMCWIKNGIELYFQKDNKIEILDQPNFLFQGECKDINTFRKIIKLLGI
jgi:hypothetical protein